MQPEKTTPASEPVAPSVAPDTRELIARGLAEAAQALLKTANFLLQQNGLTAEFSSPANQPLTKFARDGHQLFAGDVRTVSEAINEFLIVKAKARVSDRYLRTLRVSLCAFSRGRCHTLLHEVTAQDCEQWIYGMDVRPKTMHGYLGDVQTLYHWCQRRGYVTHCPADAVELPASDTKHIAPALHTPEEVSAVLESLRASDLDICRMIAIRYFAGVRSAEAHRLREEDLKLEQGLLEVPALKAKTRSRRLVTIQPCLAAWLALGGTLRNLCPENVRQKIRLSGVDWKHNVTRHSFVSNHYAAFGDAKKTAREAGHTEEILFTNYRALRTEEQGKAYFAVYPKNHPADNALAAG